MVTYVDFIPEKDKAGNELKIGQQIIRTVISERNTYLIIGYNTRYKSFEVNPSIWESKISSMVDEIETTFTMTTQNGRNMKELSNPIKLAETNVPKIEIPKNNKELLEMMEIVMKSNSSSLAVAHKDGMPISNGGKNTIIGVTLSTVNALLNKYGTRTPTYTYAPIAIGTYLTNESIRKTPASRMRLIYEYKRNYGKKFFKPVKK